MSIATGLAKVAVAGIGALLPGDCFLCAAPADNQILCAACRADLPRLPADCCPLCALPAPGAQPCGACLKRTPHFDATRAAFIYDYPLDRLILSLKYGHRLAGADFLGRELTVPPGFGAPDLIVPVPLAAARLAQRGFNQALELARPLARALGVPLALEGIRRRRDTAPQAGLPWKERAANIRHAFECDRDFRGKRVLVVDDVMTTGATLDELARTLKAHGAALVGNCVLARALRH